MGGRDSRSMWGNKGRDEWGEGVWGSEGEERAGVFEKGYDAPKTAR